MKQFAPLENKLANENFLNRAPADVIERERQRLQEMIIQLESIQENLEWLE